MYTSEDEHDFEKQSAPLMGLPTNDNESLPDSAQNTIQESDPSSDIDPFVPFDNLPSEQNGILTIRAVVVGLLCGGLVNASNIYLGLKSGWTAGANIFGVSLRLPVGLHPQQLTNPPVSCGICVVEVMRKTLCSSPNSGR
jgi:hypothetical protein